MLNSSITNFFAIFSKYCKNIIIFYYVERREMGEKIYNFEIYYFIM